MSKVWFITGANRGIGLEIAKAALAAGDRVVATARRLETLAPLSAHGERVLHQALDVDLEADAMRAVEQATARFGGIDVLVNNAGYGQLGLFEQIDAEQVEQQFRTNVFGLMHVTRAVLPVMRRRRAGRIFNIASVAGFRGFDGAAVYCASKFAVEGFSASLAAEVAGFGIRVTTVEPGFFRTDFLQHTSVRYGGRQVAAYATLDTPPLSSYEAYNGRQPGDPAKLGRALVELAAMAEPPSHFVAGSDAVGFARETFAARLREVEAHAERSAALDVDA